MYWAHYNGNGTTDKKLLQTPYSILYQRRCQQRGRVRMLGQLSSSLDPERQSVHASLRTGTYSYIKGKSHSIFHQRLSFFNLPNLKLLKGNSVMDSKFFGSNSLQYLTSGFLCSVVLNTKK